MAGGMASTSPSMDTATSLRAVISLNVSGGEVKCKVNKFEDVQRGLGSGGPFTVRSHVLGGRARIWGGGGFLYVEVKYIMDNGDVGPTLHEDR